MEPSHTAGRMDRLPALPEGAAPRVRVHFLVCTNERPPGHALPCCAAGEGMAVFQAFNRAIAARAWPPGVKVTQTGCLTPCQHGPNVVVYPEGIWYAHVTPSDVSELLAAHIDGDGAGRVERLLLPPEVQVA